MARQTKILTTVKVAAITEPGRYADGDCLYLQVNEGNRKRWIVLARINGKRAELGVGSARDVKLKDARDSASALLKRIKDGEDPRIKATPDPVPEVEKRQLERHTFRQSAETYIAAHEAGWKNDKHRQQWRNTLATYVYPTIGDMPVADIGTAEVMAILEPIWRAKPETAGRIRGRMETVLDAAKARGLRQGENPARWRGHVEAMLPPRKRLSRGHHKAMPYEEVPAFVGQLHDRDATAALALEFTLLTAARSGEVLGATWAEIDLDKAVWTIPPARMKAGREHRVPLSTRATEILRKVHPLGKKTAPESPVFPSARGNQLSVMAMAMLMRRMEIDVTVHGFRSSFRDWAAETTQFPHEVCEMALAHTIANQAERAYRRGDLFTKRVEMMEAWAIYCSDVS